MLDRLFDFITDILELFQFWVVIDEYERGVVKTLGKRRRKNPVLDPGFHFVFPLGIDEVLVDNVVPCVDEFDEQSLTTKDGKAITLNAVVMWSISDIQKILFDVRNVWDHQ
jgi:regulator of protease activity HflC (stomatin/prohibitin superfamily)